MDLLEIGMIGIAVMVGVNVIAPKIGVASPLLLVLLGIGISFLPFVAPIEVRPEWILAGILPPLLYSSAVNMPAMDFRRDLRTISAFSVLLVLGSAVIIGWVMSRLIPGLDLATGIALGAILSPTDAVATSIVRRAGVAPRLVTVLEGESLLNDASALVLLRSATAATALLTGSIAADFAWAVVVAVIIGLLIGRLNLLVRAHIHHPTSNVAISFVVPFFAYIPAERLDASGLVAAVVAGLVTGHGAPRFLRAEDRITADSVWRTLEMLLESANFLLMGLELYGLVVDVHEAHGSVWTAIWLGLLAAVLVIALRALFVAPSLWLLARRSRRDDVRRDRLTSFQDQLEDGTLAARIGSDVEADQASARELRFALLTRVSDQLARDELTRVDGAAFSPGTLDWARRFLATLTVDPQEREAEGEDLRTERGELRLAVIEQQRAELLRLRDLGTYPSAVLEETLAQLDADQLSLELRSRS